MKVDTKVFQEELTKIISQVSQGIKKNQRAGVKILSLQVGELYAPYVTEYFRKIGYTVRHSLPNMIMISVFDEEGDI